MRPPLFVSCKRVGCDGVRQVRRPNEQRKGLYCSRRCANIVNRNITVADASKGGLTRSKRARERIRLKVEGMAPIDAFRYGYTLGLGSKVRQLKKHWAKRAA